MQVILLQDIDNLGSKYDVCTVKGGYGRNFLIPQKMAIVANKPNMAKLDEIKAKEAAELERRIDEFRAISDRLAETTIKIGAKVGIEDKIFGSVTSLQLAQAVKDQTDIDIDRKKIEVGEVKTLGTYEAKVDLHPALDTKINFEVVAE